MPETDNPLKLLFEEFAADFAAWLLNVDTAQVCHVQPVNIELPARALRSDTIFRITLADGRVTLLHIEFQGRRSERPMPWRMLDYLSRLAQREPGDLLCSAVIYVGEGAGATDTGTYRVACPAGDTTLAWHYQIIRLWQMPAEDLLALDHPALLALVGQTRIRKPEQVIPQVVETIQQVPGEQRRIRLLAALTSLMKDEEMLKMVEKLVETIDPDLMLDTPFLRRIREKERAEGRTEGWAEGRTEGRIEELTKVIQDVLTTRLELSVPTYRQLERRLSAITDLDRLRALFRAALQVADVAEFERVLSGNGSQN